MPVWTVPCDTSSTPFVVKMLSSSRPFVVKMLKSSRTFVAMLVITPLKKRDRSYDLPQFIITRSIPFSTVISAHLPVNSLLTPTG